MLETEMTCHHGRVRLIDFMPIEGAALGIIRLVEGLEGQVPTYADLKPRFAYGRLVPWIQCETTRATLTSGPDALAVSSPVPFVPDWNNARLETSFVVRAGERLPFTMRYYPSHEPPPDNQVSADRELERTARRWREWASRCCYRGPYRDAVVRSLITLKALTYGPTGGIVAAPTTSLPEELGGTRNWDYRYCWLRDSSLTLHALMQSGYVEEAHAWRDWLLRAVAGAPAQMQIMYGVTGGHRLTEVQLPWLPGYEASRPVRIGNAAYDQFQLDVYGETINIVYESRKYGLPARQDAWDQLLVLVDFVAQNWQRPDEGIWEIRGARQLQFTYSKLMAWVALDRAVRLIEEFDVGARHRLTTRLQRWRAVREEIRDDVLTKGFNPRVGAFTQSYGSDALDASVLLMPHMGFLPADDPRIRTTVAAIEQHLTSDGFVFRYATGTGVDGLAGEEAPFLLCSFWLADNYAMAGRLEEAQTLLERLLSLSNDVGLLSEEYHPKLGRQLGNFPQAFSHIGLINTAFLLEAKRTALETTRAA